MKNWFSYLLEHRRFSLPGSMVLILLLATTAPAQTLSVSITVVDPQQAAVPFARVSIYPQAFSSPIQGTTDEQGSFTVSLPAVSNFLLEVDADGFRKTSRPLSASSGGDVNEVIALEIAGIDSSIIVTASDSPQTIDQISKAITVVSAEEISQRGENSLAGVLSTMPGVQVHNNGGPGQATSLRVRGLRPDSSAVLIDGMRFRDAATAQGDASSFLASMNIISPERIEMLRGSGSSLYGTNAASGVVNIITAQGAGRARGSIQAEGGNLGLARGKTQVSGGVFSDRLKYSGGVTHLNVMRGVDGNDRTRSTGGQASLIYEITPRLMVSGRYYGSDDFVQLNISPTAAGIPASNIPSSVIVPAVAQSTYLPGSDDPDYRRASRFHTAAIKLQHTVSSALSFQTSYQRVHTRRIFNDGPGGRGFQPVVANYSRYIGDIDTFDVRSTVRLSNWNQITAGYEFEREGYDELQDNNRPEPARLRTQTDIRQTAKALYFQDQSSLLENRLQLSLSGRSQAFRLNHPLFRATGISNNYDRIQLVAPPKALTADMSVSYFVNAVGTKLRVHAGNAYRAPGLFERFGAGFFTSPSTGEVQFTPYGNPFLSPDRYNSIDGGIDQYLWRDRLRISATYFYSRVVTITAFDNGTTVRAATDPYGRSSGYINGSGGLSRGIELGWELRPDASLTLKGSYTYARANLDRDITVPGFWRVLGVPRNATTLVVTKGIATHAGVAMDLYGSSEVFGNFTAAGRPRAYRYPAFVKVDASGYYDLPNNDRGQIRLHCRIENLLNRTYYDLGWRAPGTTFVAGLSFQF